MDQLHETTLAAIASIHDIGITMPSPASEINIPLDYSRIGNLGENNIGDLMGQLAAYISYIEYQTSLAESDHEAWNNVYEFEKKRKMLSIEAKRRDLMEAEVEAELIEQKNLLLQKYSKMRLLKAILEGKKRILDSLSRELSRRSLVLQIQRGTL